MRTFNVTPKVCTNDRREKYDLVTLVYCSVLSRGKCVTLIFYLCRLSYCM